MIRIRLTSVLVDDQAKARDFYTKVLGFTIRHDEPIGDDFWLTVTAADDPGGVELLLEPNGGIAEAPVFQRALYEAGIPITAFGVDDLDAEYRRLAGLGVQFRGEPSRPESGPATVRLDDTCGNLIQLYQL
jgi:catechol 2,3-dioxygenase-like lactoylglutathione lyase family enzyme